MTPNRAQAIGSACVMSRPAKTIAPPLGSSSPVIVLSNVDFRTESLQLVGDDGEETLKFQRGNENLDRVVKGKRRLLVSFAINEAYFYSCLDLCDESPDPAVWWKDYSDCGVQFARLSEFLAALRS